MDMASTSGTGLGLWIAEDDGCPFGMERMGNLRTLSLFLFLEGPGLGVVGNFRVFQCRPYKSWAWGTDFLHTKKCLTTFNSEREI